MSLVFIKSIFFDKESPPRKIVPVVALILFCFSGAAVFEVLEQDGPCARDFWSSLFFVNTVVTTIGDFASISRSLMHESQN